jgi:ferredoxin-type protein NapG
MKRRGILAALAAAATGALGLPAHAARKAWQVRPPGALSGAQFEARCIRCIRCAEVCPPKAIRFESRWPTLGSDLPFLVLQERACILCMRCTQVCPTGALEPIAADLGAVGAQVRMGEPVLERSKCLPWTGEGICRLCFYVCPFPNEAVVLVGPQQAPLFEPSHCVGCGLCEEACPTSARAVRIRPRGGGA